MDKLMRTCLMIVAMIILLGVCSCQSGNGLTGWANELKITIIPPGDMKHGDEVTWTAAVSGGVAPYTYRWNFSSAAEPSIVEAQSATVTVINPSPVLEVNPVLTLVVHDSNGLMNIKNYAYTIGPRENNAPFIESAVHTRGLLTVTVSDPDDDESLTVSITPINGINADAISKQASATGPYTVQFHLSADDLMNGAMGTTTVSVTDGHLSASRDVEIDLRMTPLTADTLYAIPLSEETVVSASDSADGKVTVVVVQGTPANAFHYMNGVGIVVRGQVEEGTLPSQFVESAGAYYVRGSFDYGAVDDNPDTTAADPVDGIWSTMSPNLNFLLVPDNMINAYNISSTHMRIDFNISPVNGEDLTGAGGAGVLFNFKLGFGAPGEYVLSFEEHNGVNRTFYSDKAGNQYFWGTISNDHTGIPNSITVTAVQ